MDKAKMMKKESIQKEVNMMDKKTPVKMAGVKPAKMKKKK
jgi:hypothetical protein